MSMDSFELFTREGEDLADRLVRGICADIREDRLTRRQALDRIADAMEKISAIDEGMSDPEPVRRIAARVASAFEEAGFLPIAGDALRDHFSAWRRAGAEVSQTSALPDAVTLVTSAARAFAAAAAPLFGRDDFRSLLTDIRPWDDAFAAEPIASAELVMYTCTGDFTGNPNVCCVVAGPSGYVYLEQLVEVGIGDDYLRQVLKRDGLDYPALAADLRRLADAVHSVNIASHLLNRPDRLRLNIEQAKTGPMIVALWDGEPISAARHDDAASMALSGGRISAEFLPEILRSPAPAPEADMPAEVSAGAPAPMPPHAG